MTSDSTYIHALRFPWLNWLYDPLVRLTTREAAVKARLIDLLPQDGSNLLDLACGSGTLARAIKQHNPVYRVMGIDGDEDMLRRAREKSVAAGISIEYNQGFAQALPYADDAFDVVTSSLFFHHLTARDKGVAFAEVCRVLRPGGTFILADWGRGKNIWMRSMFLLVRLLDGFETTRDNARGYLPKIMRESGFSKVDRLAVMATPLGTIDILQATI
jgi:ubiquinone/menaquinone biosynthesis C-methylase UbiE